MIMSYHQFMNISNGSSGNSVAIAVSSLSSSYHFGLMIMSYHQFMNISNGSSSHSGNSVAIAVFVARVEQKKKKKEHPLLSRRYCKLLIYYHCMF